MVTKGSGEGREVVTKGVMAAKCIGMAARMLHGLCFGEEAGARNLVEVAAGGDERYLVCAAGAAAVGTRLVPSMCFATSGCSCVRSSMRFLKW